MISGDIIKNLFTLYQVQRQKLKKRREEITKDKQRNKKTFFDEMMGIDNDDDDEGEINYFPRMRFKTREDLKAQNIELQKKIQEEIKAQEDEDVTSESSKNSSQGEGF